MKNVSERIFFYECFLIDNKIMKFKRNFNELNSGNFGSERIKNVDKLQLVFDKFWLFTNKSVH